MKYTCFKNRFAKARTSAADNLPSMAKTKPTQAVKPVTVLIKPREFFKDELLSRILIGEALSKSEITNTEQLAQLDKEIYSWDDYNEELIKRSFNNQDSEYQVEYSRLNSMSGMADYLRGVNTNTFSYKLQKSKENIDNSIAWLRRLIDKLTLIQEEASIMKTLPKEKKYSMDIFISHSSQDRDIAKSLIEIIRSALNIPANRIRCTSLSGYKLPIGASTDDQLRNEIFDSKVFIGIISPASIHSSYVLFELGARWGARLPLLPLTTSKMGITLLEGPLKNINALDCCIKEDLFQFINDLSGHLEIPPENPSVYNEKINELVNLSLEAPI